MARPKKTTTAPATATDEPEADASEEGAGRDIAPLFAECKTPVYAEDVADITLRRKNRDGRYTTIVMDQVDDEETGLPFAYDSYKHGEEDIGRVFGPGAYMAIPKDEAKKLLGVRFEFELEREIRASKTAVRKLSARDRGFDTGPDAPANDAPEPESEGPSEDEIEDIVNERVEAAVAEAMKRLAPVAPPAPPVEDTVMTMIAKEFIKGRSGQGGDRLDRGLEVAEHFEKIRESSLPMIEDMKTNHAAALKLLNSRIDSLEKSKQLSEETKHAELDEQRRKHNREREKLEETKNEEIATLRKKHEKEIEEKDEAIKREKKRAENELEEQREKHKREIRTRESQEEADRRRLSDEIATLSRRASTLTDDKDSAERSARAKIDEEVRRVRDEADKKVKAAETDLELALAKRRKDILAIEEEVAGKIKTLEGERDAARREVLKLEKELASIPEEEVGTGKDDEDLYPPGTPKLVKQVAPSIITAGLGYLKEAGEKASREERHKETADREASRAREREAAARERELAAENRARQLERELAEMRSRGVSPEPAPAPAPAPATGRSPAPEPAPAPARAPARPRAAAAAQATEPAPMPAAPPADPPAQPDIEPPFIRPAPQDSYAYPAPPPPDAVEGHEPAAAAAAAPSPEPEHAVGPADLAMQTGTASTAGGTEFAEDEEDEAAA